MKNLKITTHYESKENVKEMIETLKDFIKTNEEVIIVNIGSDRCIGDSVAPLVGTILQENDCPLKVYGTIENPIHALNIGNKLKEIKKLHPNAKVIGIDACLGDIEDIGEIHLRDYPIKPGKGVGKDLQSVGDMSIIGITDEADNNVLFTNRNIRLDLVYKISSLIAEIIMKSCKSRRKIKLHRIINKIKTNDNKNIKEVAIN